MHTTLPYSPELIADRLAGTDRRILLFGESGIGKSALAAELAREFATRGRICLCIGADPGSPSFGVPGCIGLGRWQDDGWRLLAVEALCTLDGGRFRLPLVSAVRRLAEAAGKGLLLVDAPGIVRGVSGAELLCGIVEAAAINLVLVLARDAPRLPLANELATTGREVVRVQPSPMARIATKRQRARQRTRLWDAHLQGENVRELAVDAALLTGTPPPLAAVRDWQGRQIGLLKKGRTVAVGEVAAVHDKIFQLRIADFAEQPDQFLVRDAYRNGQGRLETFRPQGVLHPRAMPPDIAPWTEPAKNSGPRPLVRIGEAAALLVNGVFGDPLLHLRLQNRKRSLLFDLGEGGRLPARLAHQVTDVFISHAHIDHISGFLWLMRSRIGVTAPCRLFGPPGLAECIAGLLNGIHWDRIGEGGPRFVVGELEQQELLLYGLRAGKKDKTVLGSRPAPDGLLLADADCRVRAVSLAHAGIPSLAFRLELAAKLNVRKSRLAQRSLAPGPWLGELKKQLREGKRQSLIRLPDGLEAQVGQLADELIRETAARTMVYATDLSDTLANRQKLVKLGREVDIFFCEAAFLSADKQYAERSGHLTAQGCGEIAREAEVQQVVPFHFSRRYEEKPMQIYDEVRDVSGKLLLS